MMMRNTVAKIPLAGLTILSFFWGTAAYGQVPEGNQDALSLLNQSFAGTPNSLSTRSGPSFAPTSDGNILGGSSDYLDVILGRGNGGDWGTGDNILGDILGQGNGNDILGTVLGQGNGNDILGTVLGQGNGNDILGTVLGQGNGNDILGTVLGQGNGNDILGTVLGQGNGNDILGTVLGQGNGNDILGTVLGQGNGNDILGTVLGQGDGSSNDPLGLGGLVGAGGLFGNQGGASIDLAMPPLNDSLTGWTTLASNASSSIVDNITRTFSSGSGPSLVTGSLGVPDVLASQAALRQSILGAAQAGSPTSASQGADRFNINPYALSASLGQEVSRAASVGFSNTLLSEQGQQAIQQEVETADETLQTIVEIAEAAQELDVTQDVMKELTTMLAHQSSLDVAQYGQSIQLRQQVAADALVQAEAAEELSTLNRRQNSDDIAAAAEVIQSSATLLLF